LSRGVLKQNTKPNGMAERLGKRAVNM